MENLMIKVNVSTLSDEQLECLISDAKNEQENRKRNAKREAWKKVINAIADFVDEFDSFVVCDDDNYSIIVDERYLYENHVGFLMSAEEDDDDEDE